MMPSPRHAPILSFIKEDAPIEGATTVVPQSDSATH